MYQYGKMYIKGQGIEKNEKEGIKFIKMSISYGFVRASCEYGLYLMNRNQGNDNQEGLNYVIDAINKGFTKANFIYGRTKK